MNLDFRNTNSLWCSVLAETLHRRGVRHAVVSPGSRSAPLVFALASHPKIEAIPVLDERSAAFFALGLSKQKSRTQSVPVALVCTSGTAAANFLPAIIEARESGAPLIVITADRPPEMRECGSGQTIDQQKLYGSHVNWYHELAVPEASLERLRYLRQTVAHACARAMTPERGPVHLNAPFRDPLPPVENETAKALRKKIKDSFFTHISECATAVCIPENEKKLVRAKRGIIIAGPDSGDIGYLSSLTGWPVLADALSQTRHCDTPGGTRISAYDVILRNEKTARELAPDYVICVGGYPTSKVLRTWLGDTQPEILISGSASKNRDPLHGRTNWFCGHIDMLDFSPIGKSGSPKYVAAWKKAESAARKHIDSSLAKIAGTDLFEPRAASLLAQYLPSGTPLFVANSMPVRDAEYFWPANNRGTRFFHNRGANGIDGTLSTALGIAHDNEKPAVLLTGDLSLLHDTNGFLNAKRLRGSLTIVLVNNNGGGIFEHLPVAKFDPPFEEFFATPQNVDFAKLCATYGVEHTLIENWSLFVKLISTLPARGVRVLEIRTDRKRDAARRKALLEQAADAAFA